MASRKPSRTATKKPITAPGGGGASEGRGLQPRVELPILLALLAAVFIAFGPAYAGAFLKWDDEKTVAGNPWLRSGGEAFIHFWAHPHMDLYIPLTYDVWAALVPLAETESAPGNPGGLDARIFHAANVTLHAVAVVLAYAILRRIVGALPAGVGAVLFAVHPAQVEPVAWVSGMKDVLSGVLCLGALWADPLATSEASEGVRASWLRYGVATLLFMAAVLAKPTAMVLPGIAIVLAWGRRQPTRGMLVRMAPWFAISLGCAAWTRAVQGAAPQVAAPLWLRPIVAGHALGTYLWKLLVPLGLGVDYGYSPAWLRAHRAAQLVAVVPVVIGVSLIVLHRRARWLIVAAAIFCLGLLPVLGLVPFDFQLYSTVADHYLYLPMFAVALAAGWIVARLRPRGQLVVGIVLLVVLGGASWTQARYWRDDETLFRHTLEVNPRSVAALDMLRGLAIRQGDPRRAEELARRTLEVRADYPKAWAGLGAALAGQQKSEEALAAYRTALELSPADPEILVNYGIALAQAGRLDQATDALTKAIQINPDDAGAHMNLGTVYVNLNRLELARQEYERATTLDPVNPQTHTNLGFVLAELHEPSRARDEFNAALRLVPGYPPAVRGLQELR